MKGTQPHDDMAIDAREKNLAAWARELIRRLRTEVRSAQGIAHAAVEAAMLARGATRPHESAITYDGPDGETYGLPAVTTVNFGDISVTPTPKGLHIEGTGDLYVIPRAPHEIVIRGGTNRTASLEVQR